MESCVPISGGFLAPFAPLFIGAWLYADSWIWTVVGFAGAAVFGSRFVLQWLSSEKNRTLVVPWYFWHLSFWGSTINLVYALGADYRANGAFLMNSKTVGAVRKMRDADGRFLWSDGLAAGEPARLMGYPVVVSEDMPDIAANAYAIAFGDFRSAYTIAERPDLRILRDPFSAKPNVLFYANKRVGGDITDFAAVKLLKIAVS